MKRNSLVITNQTRTYKMSIEIFQCLPILPCLRYDSSSSAIKRRSFKQTLNTMSSTKELHENFNPQRLKKSVQLAFSYFKTNSNKSRNRIEETSFHTVVLNTCLK